MSEGSGVFLLEGEDTIVAMQPGEFVKEDDFQRLLSRFPELLVGDQIDPVSPRRWILSRREQQISAGGANSSLWSIDHVFLDQDGIPTLVEVKRQSDSRIRREFVGQMLDYAANCAQYWTAEIHRHNIEHETEAFLVEAALIDAFPGLTNIKGGHASVQYGCRTAREIVVAYSAPPLVAFEPLILVFIGRSLEDGLDVYTATRAAWKMSIHKVSDYRLVLAYDLNGLVRGAFRPTAWKPAIRVNFPFLRMDVPNRIGFDGDSATDVSHLYLGRKVPARKRGSILPFRYLDPKPGAQHLP